MNYNHTQKAPLHLILNAIAAVLFVGAWISRHQPSQWLILAGVGATFVLVALMFGSLAVRDERNHLGIRYGPLPVIRKRIPYSSISSVEQSRSAIIDGWGIHWIPGRGHTYNLWGFDCAMLKVNGRTIRIGSDDVANLVEFLKSKIN